MNEDTIRLDARPEVAAFVAAVRSRLGDLTEEEREELLGGLEADLSERLAEGESADLGDPTAYAAELRAAAGLEVRRRRGWGSRRPVKPLREDVVALLDGSRQRLDAVVADGRPAVVWEFLVILRPLWWFVRAWMAVQLLDLVTNDSDLPTIVPTLLGLWPGVIVTAVFTVVSVQIGRGRWWPGTGVTRSLGPRLLLLGLNVFAIVVTPTVLGQFPGPGTYVDDSGYATPMPGIQNRGSYVANIFPYDAEGKPLIGVQLFDQAGRPLVVNRDARAAYYDSRGVTVSFPWYNGGQRLWNVFPLPGRTAPDDGYGPPRVTEKAWTSTNPPVLPTAPLAVVPPVALPTPAPAEPQVTPSSSPSTDSEKPRRR